MRLKNKEAEEFEKWFREYMEACINHWQIYGENVSGEKEIEDVSKKVDEIITSLK